MTQFAQIHSQLYYVVCRPNANSRGGASTCAQFDSKDWLWNRVFHDIDRVEVSILSFPVSPIVSVFSKHPGWILFIILQRLSMGCVNSSLEINMRWNHATYKKLFCFLPSLYFYHFEGILMSWSKKWILRDTPSIPSFSFLWSTHHPARYKPTKPSGALFGRLIGR